jgi:hypothetical protein
MYRIAISNTGFSNRDDSRWGRMKPFSGAGLRELTSSATNAKCHASDKVMVNFRRRVSARESERVCTSRLVLPRVLTPRYLALVALIVY